MLIDNVAGADVAGFATAAAPSVLAQGFKIDAVRVDLRRADRPAGTVPSTPADSKLSSLKRRTRWPKR